MKIIIAGNGKVGDTLARQLAVEGYDITIIDRDKEALNNCVEHNDVMTVEGNCASQKILRIAGAASANLLIAATGNDEVNLLCCMMARNINPNIHTISRIRNPEYTEQAYNMKDEFALAMIINPEKQAAMEIERLIHYPGFLKRDTFSKGKAEIVELKIEPSSKLCGTPLNKIYNVIKCKVLVCAVVRHGVAFTPDGNFTLLEGDRIFVTAPSDNLSALLKNLGIVTKKIKQVLIIGGGTISHYLAAMLERRHIDVKIIEKDERKCKQLSELLPDAEIVCGDASSQSLLESEGIDSCDALVALTGIDETNMIISLYGKSRGVPLTVTKLGRLEDTNIIDNLALGSIITPRKLCCNMIIKYVRAMKKQTGAAVTIHSIADGYAEAVEFNIEKDSPHCGKPLKKLSLKKNVLVASITHGGETEIPNGDSHYSVGDSVIIVAGSGTVLKQFNDIFE